MNVKSKRLLSLAVSALMVLTILGGVAPAAAAPSSVVIYHTNDMHSNVTIQSEKPAEDGFNLAHVKALKDSTPGALLVDAGDATQGKPFATLSQGNGVIQLMNAVGYDAMVLGNHEFDYGQAALLKNIGDAKFPVFGGNVVIDKGKADEPSLADKVNTSYVVKEAGGRKIAFFGLISPETAVTASPANQSGVTFASVGETAKKIVADIKAKEKDVEAIICLSHCGVDPSAAADTLSTAIADACGADLAAIIDGHSHTVMMGNEAVKRGGTIIVSTGSGLANVGKLELTFDGGKVTAVSSALAKEEMAKLTPDAGVTGLIADINEKQKAQMSRVVGKTTTNLYAGNVTGDGDVTVNVGRLNESNLCNLVTDSFLWYAKNLFKDDPVYKDYAFVAYSGGGGVRVPLPAGEITMEDVMTVLPFSNEAYFLKISPKTLYRLAEVGVGKVEKQDPATGLITGANGRFVQPAGFTMEVDYRKDPIQYNDETGELVKDGSRVLKITLADGTVLDRNNETKNIIVLSNSYDFSGGDGHWELKNEAELVRTDKVTEEILADYIAHLMTLPENKNGFAMPLSEGRIKVSSGYAGTGFDVTVTGPANTQLKYAVDGVEKGAVTTDAAGKAVIKGLKNGPQEITLTSAAASHTALVDNYVGFTQIVMESNPATGAAGTAKTAAALGTAALFLGLCLSVLRDKKTK